MKNKNTFTILIFLIVIFFSQLASAGIYCKHKEPGWVPADSRTGIEYKAGDGIYFDYNHCMSAVNSSNSYFICGPRSPGSAIFNVETGKIVGKESAYFHYVEHCNHAVKNQSNGVVCAPRAEGSSTYDTKYNRFIGNAYWFHINHCVWSSHSARATDDFICGPTGGYSTVFSRSTGKKVEGHPYFHDIVNCHRYLR
jgi:hypothetical protein